MIGQVSIHFIAAFADHPEGHSGGYNGALAGVN